MSKETNRARDDEDLFWTTDVFYQKHKAEIAKIKLRKGSMLYMSNEHVRMLITPKEFVAVLKKTYKKKKTPFRRDIYIDLGLIIILQNMVERGILIQKGDPTREILRTLKLVDDYEGAGAE